MENNSVFKNLNPERDVLYLQTVERESLFGDKAGVVQPYTGDEEVIDMDQPTEDSTFFTQVRTVANSNNQVGFFSTARGLKTEVSEGDEYMYNQIKQLTRPDRDLFTLEEFGEEVTEIDVVALSREWYKDDIDPNYFSVFLNVSGTSSPSSTPTSFAIGDNVLGLYAGEENRQSRLGKKKFLYPTTSTAELYDTSTDELTMVSQSELDKTIPYGEVYLDAGLIILFTNIIEDPTLGNRTLQTTSTLHFLAGVVGRSEIQLNSSLYYLRLYNQEFNYTTNPTFYEDVDDNIIKSKFRNQPTTYVTTVGMYNSDNDLIAVGKLSRPIEKNFKKEAIIHAQLSI